MDKRSLLLFLGTAAFGGATGYRAAEEEASLLAEVQPAELVRHAREIVRHQRPSGSPGEFAAIDYIVTTLRSEAIPVEVYEFSAYLSDPVRASFRIEPSAGRGAQEFPALTQAFSASTGASGVSGELVDCGKGEAADYGKVDVRGKIVLLDGLADPDGVQAAQQAGAAGAVFAASSDRVNEMTVGPVWGTPEPDDLRVLPRIPSLAVSREAGVEIRRRLSAGPVRVNLSTEVATGWKTLRLPVASIRSARDPEGFVLVGGHIDGWHHGATDEGASNAAMVEMARIFYRHRSELERGLKLAWWPGHSNGRYAGSTWYADRFWLELRRHALAYLNIDGVGQKDASLFSVSATAELEPLGRALVKEQAGVEPRLERPGRNSDQSFYGVGLPLLQFNHSRSADLGYWWWHTPEDTFDKIDFDVLATDTRLYVAALHRLVAGAQPPLQLSAATAELADLLAQRSRTSERLLELKPAVELAERLHNLAVSLDDQLQREPPRLDPPELARRLVSFLRPLNRVTYQERGPYHQDPALERARLPGLAALGGFAELESRPDLAGFTRAYLIRELNRLLDHLDQALAEGEALAGEIAAPPK
jgi:N-acetylated-alpha-linked acidic dipeptidase